MEIRSEALPKGAMPGEDSWLALASPGPGMPMTTRVERELGPIREFAEELGASVAVDAADFDSCFAPRVSRLGYSPPGPDLASRTAWALVAEWLCGYALGALDDDATIREAETWFLSASRTLPRLAGRAGRPPIANVVSRR